LGTIFWKGRKLTNVRFSYYILLLKRIMQEQKEPMSGKKLFGIVAVVMIGAVIAGLTLFTNFL
jgi:hypothetical protein